MYKKPIPQSNIAAYRKLLGLSQFEFGDLIGISQPKVSQVERGQAKLEDHELEAAKKVLSFPLPAEQLYETYQMTG